MTYTNSSLATYKKISPNRTSPRNHIIDTITIHCYVGKVTAKGGCNATKFTKYNATNGCSCNYVIGYDGSIGLCVEEKDRSWCSSNRFNDHRAITIEVASESVRPYAVTDKALEALIELCADICKRNNIKKLVWSTNKADRVNHRNGCNMTVHRDYANKSCPGEYLYNKHPYIVEQVNKKLGVATSNVTSASNNTSSTATSVSKLKVDSNVKAVQTWLNTYYNSGLAVDGSYGSKTKSALVKAWQKEVGGLEIDGKFGPKSQAKASANNIKKGSKGILVTIWQAFLVCKGYNPNGIDGSFGNGCHKATVAFQKANKLTTDGIVGKGTLAKAFR